MVRCRGSAPRTERWPRASAAPLILFSNRLQRNGEVCEHAPRPAGGQRNAVLRRRVRESDIRRRQPGMLSGTHLNYRTTGQSSGALSVCSMQRQARRDDATRRRAPCVVSAIERSRFGLRGAVNEATSDRGLSRLLDDDDAHLAERREPGSSFEAVVDAVSEP